MTLAGIRAAALEDWLRHRYFSCRIDISSSGMQPYSLGALRGALGLDWSELDDVEFTDSPSLGGDRLRSAIARRYAPEHVERVMVTTGSSEAIFLALSALIRPGDEVVVLRPAYQSLVSVAESLGAILRFWDLHAADDFRPDLANLARLLSPATRAVVVNFPHNPTGATLSANAYRTLLELIDRNGSHLVWDGAFAELSHDGPALPDPTNALSRCVSTGTMSKSYALPGLRVGWCFAPPTLLADMVRIRDYVTLNVCPVNELIAAAVLEQADRLLTTHRDRATLGRAAVIEWALANTDRVSLPMPGGGVTAFPEILGLSDVTELATRLADEDGVLVVPGGCFGHPARLRIGFGGPVEQLTVGLERLSNRLPAGLTAHAEGRKSS